MTDPYRIFDERAKYSDETDFRLATLRCPVCGNERYNRVNGDVECGRYGHRYPLPEGWSLYMASYHASKRHMLRKVIGG